MRNFITRLFAVFMLLVSMSLLVEASTNVDPPGVDKVNLDVEHVSFDVDIVDNTFTAVADVQEVTYVYIGYTVESTGQKEAIGIKAENTGLSLSKSNLNELNPLSLYCREDGIRNGNNNNQTESPTKDIDYDPGILTDNRVDIRPNMQNTNFGYPKSAN